MTIRELLDELRRIAEMQSMVESINRSAPVAGARTSQLLTVAIKRAESRLRERFPDHRIQAATRMSQLLAENAT